MAVADPAFVLTDRDFSRVRRLIYEYAGIKLSEQKRNMVYNRLVRRLRSHGGLDFTQYLDMVQSERSDEREAFVNALTTNLTSFFREPHHFDLLAAWALVTLGGRRHTRGSERRTGARWSRSRPLTCLLYTSDAADE